MKRRVVVTGMGAVTPVGLNVEETFKGLVSGKSGISLLETFDTSDFKVKVAGEIKNLNLEEHFSFKEIKKYDRVILLALLAAREAYSDSKLTKEDYDSFKFGTYVTSGIGGINTLFGQAKMGISKGYSRVTPYFTTNSIINMPGAIISIEFGLNGAVVPIVTACSASNNAIGEAYRNIKDGYLDLAFAGGTESSINELGISAFQALRALSFEADPKKASRPFDLNRNGFVMSEGAGILVLEEYEHAKKRGAKIYAEIAGYGTTSDAYHITAPDSEGKGISRAMVDAIADSNITVNEIDYINAHGTSTLLNDVAETKAIKNVFKEKAYDVSISSTKSSTGHLLGATGAIESIACIKAINEGVIPPTINYETKDPECDLNYTVNKAIKKDVNYAMNMNLGFGGHNGVLIFKKYK